MAPGAFDRLAEAAGLVVGLRGAGAAQEVAGEPGVAVGRLEVGGAVGERPVAGAAAGARTGGAAAGWAAARWAAGIGWSGDVRVEHWLGLLPAGARRA